LEDADDELAYQCIFVGEDFSVINSRSMEAVKRIHISKDDKNIAVDDDNDVDILIWFDIFRFIYMIRLSITLLVIIYA
jgi:hypothetical protein